MSKRSFFIRLRSAGPYFFGGEQNFGYDGAEANYRVVSRKFPQQTALFGFLRYCLLTAEAGIFERHPAECGQIADKARAGELAGATSFYPAKPLDDFGCLEQLSPVFIYDQAGEPLLPVPLSHGYALEALSKAARNCLGEEVNMLHVLKNPEGKMYSYKDDLASGFAGSSGKHIGEEEVFTAYERIGIQKSYQGKTADRAFFKQKSFGLQEGYSFGFYVTLSKDEGLLAATSHPVPVHLGGERSVFMMETEEKEPPAQWAFHPRFHPSAPGARIVLLSDAYLPESRLRECCLFAAAATVPFRYLQTSIKSTERYYNLERAAGTGKGAPPAAAAATRSARYTLLRRGGVLYVKTGKEQDLQDCLKGTHPDHPDSPALRFRKIGYNYFSFLPSNKTQPDEKDQ